MRPGALLPPPSALLEVCAHTSAFISQRRGEHVCHQRLHLKFSYLDAAVQDHAAALGSRRGRPPRRRRLRLQAAAGAGARRGHPREAHQSRLRLALRRGARCQREPDAGEHVAGALRPGGLEPAVALACRSPKITLDSIFEPFYRLDCENHL
jgi:hypothetical protein